MANSKNPKSFRLSDQALDTLEKICELSGVNQTAAVEMSLALMLASLKKKEDKHKAWQNVYK